MTITKRCMNTPSDTDVQFPFTVLSLFSGAGGLDLGFEAEGFRQLEAVEIDPWCVATLRRNRPSWHVAHTDVRSYEPACTESPDVLLAGCPCQGFSLGGNRDEEDERNLLYREVIRVARLTQPRVVLLENVLNLRTMNFPGSDRPFAEQILEDFRQIGYNMTYDVFRMSRYGVPQTRRRFVFVAFRGDSPEGYYLPQANPDISIRPFLFDLAQDTSIQLPNHDPHWGFDSAVHSETGEPIQDGEIVLPVRFSRTASDGHPVRSFDAPFPAIDTATVWGWAQGNIQAQRVTKDRTREKYIRNPDANVTLWRVSASRLRTFTHREYARLQTFPDDWVFEGANKRDIHLQIGNAVPVRFAQCIARNVRLALLSLVKGIPFQDGLTRHIQPTLF